MPYATTGLIKRPIFAIPFFALMMIPTKFLPAENFLVYLIVKKILSGLGCGFSLYCVSDSVVNSGKKIELQKVEIET